MKLYKVIPNEAGLLGGTLVVATEEDIKAAAVGDGARAEARIFRGNVWETLFNAMCSPGEVWFSDIGSDTPSDTHLLTILGKLVNERDALLKEDNTRAERLRRVADTADMRANSAEGALTRLRKGIDKALNFLTPASSDDERIHRVRTNSTSASNLRDEQKELQQLYDSILLDLGNPEGSPSPGEVAAMVHGLAEKAKRLDGVVYVECLDGSMEVLTSGCALTGRLFRRILWSGSELDAEWYAVLRTRFGPENARTMRLQGALSRLRDGVNKVLGYVTEAADDEALVSRVRTRTETATRESKRADRLEDLLNKVIELLGCPDDPNAGEVLDSTLLAMAKSGGELLESEGLDNLRQGIADLVTGDPTLDHADHDLLAIVKDVISQRDDLSKNLKTAVDTLRSLQSTPLDRTNTLIVKTLTKITGIPF